ncbi:MAG: DUF3891 family protein [Planctomycetia bacterium]|nr:DUF3891 family protein [Planctomycetia bacterium]
MIRRDVTLADGRPGWAMISQLEHARIAAEVARAWNVAEFPLALPHEELLAAVLRHDDGWLPWEMRPTVVDGKPRDFMEMPLDESLAIWRRSIAVAQNLGPLAAYAVGSHFAALCRWSHEKAHHTATWLHLAEEFIDEQDELARERLAELVARARAAQQEPVEIHLVEIEARKNADRAWHALQFFDRVSLWLCCSERREPETVSVPESLGTGLGAFRFTPVGFRSKAAGADDTPRGAEIVAEILVEPWPLVGERLDLATLAEAVPQADYDSPDTLARAQREPVPLAWSLRRK